MSYPLLSSIVPLVASHPFIPSGSHAIQLHHDPGPAASQASCQAKAALDAACYSRRPRSRARQAMPRLRLDEAPSRGLQVRAKGKPKITAAAVFIRGLTMSPLAQLSRSLNTALSKAFKAHAEAT